jgi:hypothetical protein
VLIDPAADAEPVGFRTPDNTDVDDPAAAASVGAVPWPVGIDGAADPTDEQAEQRSANATSNPVRPLPVITDRHGLPGSAAPLRRTRDRTLQGPALPSSSLMVIGAV